MTKAQEEAMTAERGRMQSEVAQKRMAEESMFAQEVGRPGWGQPTLQDPTKQPVGTRVEVAGGDGTGVAGDDWSLFNNVPMPLRDTSGWLAQKTHSSKELTYDLSEYCPRCAIGARQKVPFRLKGEPRWGRRHVFELFWTYGEFFVRRETWGDVFEPMGVDYWPVLDGRGRELETVVQLKPKAADWAMRLVGREAETCNECGRLKYRPVVRGRLPPVDGVPTMTAWRTREWFGAGGEVGHETIVSARPFRLMCKHGVRGTKYQPLSEP